MDKNKNDKERKPKVNTFPKFILLIVELHAMVCITASYVLAFINHVSIVENLSITIVGQIVAPLVAYITGSVVSNIFEKNQLTFSTPLSAIESGIVQSSTASTTSTSSYDEYTEPIETTIGTVDNPINLDELPLFEFGDAACGRGED